MRAAIFLALGLSVALSPVSAQDFSSIGYNTVMAGILHKQKMKSVYGADRVADVAKATPNIPGAAGDNRRRAPDIAGGDGLFTAALTRSGANLPADTLSYTPDPAISRRTRARFYAVGAAASDDRLRQRVQEKVANQYETLAATINLKRSNLADTMATYMLVNWAAANPSAEFSSIDHSHAAAVRNQIRALMAGQGALATEAARQEADEELVHLTAMTSMIAKGEAAKGVAQKAKFADLVRREWKARYGQDLTKLRLGSKGFLPAS